MGARFTVSLWVLSGLVVGVWAEAGQLALLLAAAAAFHAAFRTASRLGMLQVGTALTWGSATGLIWHFVADHFSVRYVWLYSSSELPGYLKFANLWGGDEGASLLLAAFCLGLALAGARAEAASATARPWSVSAFIGGWYVALAWWLAPFAPTPAEWLSEAASQGMNAHLMKIWMLFHAPLVLIAYAWTLSLAAPALAAIGGQQRSWPALARVHARRAWVVLTAGIGFGMVWAFEDGMYGQIWHWDPVQTATFCLWCFLGAHLHGIAGWRAGRRRGWIMPWAALCAAVMTAAAMAVTRNPMLASSHRYVGADSWVAHVCLALLLLLAGWWQLWRRQRGSASAGGAGGRAASELGLWLAQLGFVVAALMALAQLAWAFAAEALVVPRPDEYKPFLGLLVNMVSGAEQSALRRAFEQWDVDGYALARLLLLPLLVFGAVGGWYFCRRLSRKLSWISLALLGVLMALLWQAEGMLTRNYAGAGVLSQKIVALLPMLDASLLAGAYLALGCLAWAAAAAFRSGWKGMTAAAPLALLHGGMVLMLWGGLLALALNSHSQHEIRVEGHESNWVNNRQGYRFRLAGLEQDAAADGGYRAAQAVHAVTTIEVLGPDGRRMDGQTLYRDDRPQLQRYPGPLRQVCEVLDYRYARHVATPGYLLDPLIRHGWTRSVQFWVAPAALLEEADGQADADRIVVAVVKVFPFLSLLWTGLVLTVAGGLWLAWPRRQSARQH